MRYQAAVSMAGRVKVPYREWTADCSAAIAKYLPKGTTPSRTALPGDDSGGDVIIDYVDVEVPQAAAPPAPEAPEEDEPDEAEDIAKDEKPEKPAASSSKKTVNTEEYLKSKRRGRG